MSKLISEPPLLVLPSLARELGLVDAIVLQQLYYAGQRTEDGWVQRSYADWSRAMRGVIAARSLERTFANLVKAGWAEQRSEAGKPTSFRATPRDERGVTLRGERGEGSAESGGSVSREEKQRKTSPSKSSPASEPDGFRGWLEHHSSVTTVKVMKAGTKARAHVASMFGARLAEGYSIADLELAVEGAWADEFRRAHGYVDPESVLRPTKVAKLVEAGRRAAAARAAEEASPYAAFDAGDRRAG